MLAKIPLFLDPYIEDGIVTLIDWSRFCEIHPFDEAHKIAACQHAAFVDCQNPPAGLGYSTSMS